MRQECDKERGGGGGTIKSTRCEECAHIPNPLTPNEKTGEGRVLGRRNYN